MKWRHSILYLLLFIFVGGYFYYFEVVKREKQAAAEKEAKKVFSIEADQVRAVEIAPRDNETIRILKETRWRLAEPIQGDVDEGALTGLIATLESLETERQIAAAPKDVKPFGLEKPTLKIRFQAGEEWKELLLGDKNPVGDGYYARTGDQGSVFLIEAGNWAVLNKGLNELRRHELFTFEREEVRELEVAWSDNATVLIRQTDNESTWKAPDHPETNIRKTKVENVLNQLHWLRATGFFENEVRNLSAYGLEPPLVTVRLGLGEGQEVTLRLGKKGKDDEALTAVSSQLPGVVQVTADFLEEFPKTLNDLEDRSLLAFDPEDIRQVKWRTEGSRGQVIQLGENKWGWKEKDAPPAELKESWRVGSLFWELQEAEYEQEVNPMPAPPAEPGVRLDLLDAEKTLGTLNWNDLDEETGEKVIVWVERGGRTQAVELKGEIISKIKSKLNDIRPPEDHP